MFAFSIDEEIRIDVSRIIKLLEENCFDFGSKKYNEIKTVYKILKDVCDAIENRFPEFKDADKDADKSCSCGCEHKCNHECNHECKYEKLETEIDALKNKIRKQKRLIRKLYRELNNNTIAVEIEIYLK